MKKFFDKIAATDFRKPAKRLVIVSIVVALVCCDLTAFMFRTQLSELAALDRAKEQGLQQQEAQANNSEIVQNGERDNDGEYGREHSDKEHDLFDAGLITRPSTAAVAVSIASIVLCGLCALAYWLMVAAWLYKASANAGMNTALWTLLGLAFNLLAVAAFLIARGGLVKCPTCSTWQKSAKFCTSCGAALETVCPTCGKVLNKKAAYCPDCGTQLKEKSSDEASAK